MCGKLYILSPRFLPILNFLSQRGNIVKLYNMKLVIDTLKLLIPFANGGRSLSIFRNNFLDFYILRVCKYAFFSFECVSVSCFFNEVFL